MTWLAWRQFRANAFLAAVTTVAVTIVLVLTRDHVAHAAQLPTSYKSLQLLGTALIGLPAFIGAFWGAPLLARELEAGTHRLAWTQSVTRDRWLTIKLAVTALTAIVVTGAFSFVFTWWSVSLDRSGDRIGTANFGQRGVVPIAYALFAIVLGAVAGALLRRTLPAMAATLLGFFVARYLFQLFVRSKLLAPITVSVPNNLLGRRGGPSSAQGAWIISTKTVDASGHVINSGQIDRVLASSCALTRNSTQTQWARCAGRLGLHDVVTMHPASQFWPLQLWEAACFLSLAAILTVACFWCLHHRTA